LSAALAGVVTNTSGSQPHPTGSGLSRQDAFERAYLTTRRDAIVDYVKALQAPEGYFHGWLAAPPPFDPDRTPADFSAALEAYDTLLNINCSSSISWTSMKAFLSSLVTKDGLLNSSKYYGVDTWTCWVAMTFYFQIGLGALINVEKTSEYVAGMQMSDGGFLLESINTRSSLTATYFALDALTIAGRLNFVDLNKARSYLASCQCSNGGYAETSGGQDNVIVTAAGIMVADMLGVFSDSERNKTAEYLMSHWDSNVGVDAQQDLYITERIAWALALLGRSDLVCSSKMLQWILNLQRHENGQFVSYPEADVGQERLAFAEYATHVIAMYNWTSSLDESFVVTTEPKWEIPQWWLDYVRDQWSTTTSSSAGSAFWLPDFRVILPFLPQILLVAFASIPAVWILNKGRVEREERRKRNRERRMGRKKSSVV
jgi:prenyltransferase beta subunit